MSAAPSAVSILAEFRIGNSQNFDADIEALQSKLVAAFEGMSIPISAAVTAGVSEAAPAIQQTVAAAVGAGVSEGMALGGGVPEMAYSPFGSVGLDSIGGGGAGSRLPPGFDMNQDEGGSGIMGLGSMNRMLSAFMLLRAARSAEEFYVKDADMQESEFKAENMPERTESQRASKSAQIIKTNQAEIDENEGFMGYLKESIQHGGLISGLKFYELDQGVRKEKIGEAEAAGSNAEMNVDQQKERRIQLENELTKAHFEGNEALAKHLELQININARQEEMNAIHARSGDTFASTIGQEMLSAQTARQQGISFLSTKEDIQSDVDTNMRSDIDLLRSVGRGGSANRAEFEIKHNEEREKLVNDIERMKMPNSGATRDQLNSAESRLGALDRTWPADITAFNNSINQSTKYINERTSELTLENSGNILAAERQRIEYQTNKAAEDADDGTPSGKSRAAAIRGEGAAEEQHLHAGIRLESPMQAWLGMQHSAMMSHPAHAATAETNPHKPGTKAYQEWETQKHIRETNAAHHPGISGPHPDAFLNMHAQNEATHKYLHGLTAGQEQSIHDHGLGYASAHRDSWETESKRQHDAAMGRVHDAQEKGVQDRIKHAHEFDAGLLDHAHISPPSMQFGPHGERLGSGPAYAPGDAAGHPSIAASTAQSLNNAARILEKSAPHILIMQPN
jgi:hypothetical protein